MMSILAVAAQRAMTQDVIRLVDSTGAKVMAVDLQAFALVRAAFGVEAEPAGGPVAFVDIGGSITQVTVVKDGTVRFLRILPLGGEDFSTALADQFGLSPEHADQLKRRVGVAIEGDPTGSDSEDQARLVLTRKASHLIDEVRGSLEYFLSQSTAESVRTVLIAGNGTRLPHLANRLSRSLGVQVAPVKMLDESRFIISPKVGLSETELQTAQPVLAVPADLALWSET